MRAAPLCSLLALGACVASPTTKDGASPGESGDSGDEPPEDTGTADTPVPNPALTDLAPGNVRDLGAYTCDDIAGAYQPCDHVSDYSGFVYDPDDHRMLMFGGGHAASITTDVPQLDLAADPLVWAPAYPSTPYDAMTLDNFDQAATSWRSTGHPLARHTIDMMAYSPRARRLVMLPPTNSFVLYTQGYPSDFPGDLTTGGDVFEYDPAARTWSSYPARPQPRLRRERVRSAQRRRDRARAHRLVPIPPRHPHARAGAGRPGAPLRLPPEPHLCREHRHPLLPAQ